MKKYLSTIIIIFNSLLILELILAAFFYFYRLNSSFHFLTPVTKSYYNLVKDIIQYDPACGMTDNELGYLLKPGFCRFKNLEFDTEFRINSAGLRDDEDSLDNPEILMLGDSYTMGWGVEQNESFASIIENKTNKKVLNAGISSYGTARQYLLLDRIQTEKLKYIILQYCDNDLNENKKYIEDPSEFSKLTNKQTKKMMAKHDRRSDYIPFRFTWNFFSYLYANFTGNIETLPSDRFDEFRMAMQLISLMEKKSPDTKIIFFEVVGANKNDPHFEDTVRRVLLLPEFESLKNKITVLDLHPLLTSDDYFIVDNHINQKGHKKIAESILAGIDRNR